MKRKVWISLCVLFCLAISGCTEIRQSDIADDTKGSSENIEDTHTQNGEEDMVTKDSVFPQHEPYGTGVGAMPGRVVWAHDPDSVDWNGEGY